MAIGSNYSIMLSIQFGDTISITDLYAYDRLYIGTPEGAETGVSAILGLCHNGAINEIISTKDMPIGGGKELEILKAILKEITTFLTNIIAQRTSTSKSSQQRSSNILTLDDTWLAKQFGN